MSFDEEIADLEARLQEASRNHMPWWDNHAPIPVPEIQGLSKVQKILLVRLYRETQAAHIRYQEDVEKYGYGLFTRDPDICGVPWWINSDDADNERSYAASQSRTLRRLATRGLVVRLNHYREHTTLTSYVRLTEAGSALAAQLHKDNG